MAQKNIYLGSGSRAAAMITLLERYLELSEQGYDDHEARKESEALAFVIGSDTLPSKRRILSLLDGEKREAYREKFLVRGCG